MSDTKDKIQGILDNDVITANRQNDLIALDIVSVVEAEIEKIRKSVQWELQRHIKNEYTIYQSKRRINEVFKEFFGVKKE